MVMAEGANKMVHLPWLTSLCDVTSQSLSSLRYFAANGMAAYAVTLITYIGLWWFGIFNPTIVYDKRLWMGVAIAICDCTDQIVWGGRLQWIQIFGLPIAGWSWNNIANHVGHLIAVHPDSIIEGALAFVHLSEDGQSGNVRLGFDFLRTSFGSIWVCLCTLNVTYKDSTREIPNPSSFLVTCRHISLKVLPGVFIGKPTLSSGLLDLWSGPVRSDQIVLHSWPMIILACSHWEVFLWGDLIHCWAL